MDKDKKLARNVNMMITAEFAKQLYDELIAVGFESSVAIDYITSLVAKMRDNNKK